MDSDSDSSQQQFKSAQRSGRTPDKAGKRRHPVARIKGGWTEAEDARLVRCAPLKFAPERLKCLNELPDGGDIVHRVSEVARTCELSAAVTCADLPSEEPELAVYAFVCVSDQQRGYLYKVPLGSAV